MTQFDPSICWQCQYLIQTVEGISCPAFPQGIPDHYIDSSKEHRELDGTEEKPVFYTPAL